MSNTRFYIHVHISILLIIWKSLYSWVFDNCSGWTILSMLFSRSNFKKINFVLEVYPFFIGLFILEIFFVSLFTYDINPLTLYITMPSSSLSFAFYIFHDVFPYLKKININIVKSVYTFLFFFCLWLQRVLCFF